MSHLQKSEGPVPLAGGPGRDLGNSTRANDSTDKTVKKPGAQTKNANLLRVFLSRGTLGLNCFESVRLAHDYVLRSTVSALTRQYGVEFQRSWEQVPGHTGALVECRRYWLSPKGAATARELLGMSDEAGA